MSKAGRRMAEEWVAVEGSYHRRILELMAGLDFELIDIEDADHPSRVTLVFDAGDYLTRITIDDVEKPEENDG